MCHNGNILLWFLSVITLCLLDGALKVLYMEKNLVKKPGRHLTRNNNKLAKFTSATRRYFITPDGKVPDVSAESSTVTDSKHTLVAK